MASESRPEAGCVLLGTGLLAQLLAAHLDSAAAPAPAPAARAYAYALLPDSLVHFRGASSCCADCQPNKLDNCKVSRIWHAVNHSESMSIIFIPWLWRS